MYRILIVDDEPYIVNTLHDQIRESVDFYAELDIYRAFTANTALEYLQRTKIDIVLTDIEMPGMNGLELQQEISKHWPKCKVIFLTAHGQFDYVHQAMRSGGNDFILKNEGVERVVEAVKQAITQIREAKYNYAILERAQQQQRSYLVFMQRDLMIRLLHEAVKDNELAIQFNDLGILLDSSKPVVMVCGRIDAWPASFSFTDKSLLKFALSNITEECFSPYAVIFMVMLDDTRFLWFIQPRDEISVHSSLDVSYATRMIEEVACSVQSSCKEMLKLTISLIIGEKYADWRDLPHAHRQLVDLLNWSWGTELLRKEGYEVHKMSRGTTALSSDYQHWREFMELEAALDRGDRQRFLENTKQWIRHALESAPNVVLESYLTLSSMLARKLNQHGQHLISAVELQSRLLIHPSTHLGEAFKSLLDLAVQLLQDHETEQRDRNDHMVKQIQDYIHSNLSLDLSLVRLAEIVYLSPPYLCREFKRITGIGLSDFIMEARMLKAKELLATTNMKILDIGKAVGYESPPYFTRNFKKWSYMTPQQFRDQFDRGTD
jgi:two-component system response regulator YesN